MLWLHPCAYFMILEACSAHLVEVEETPPPSTPMEVVEEGQAPDPKADRAFQSQHGR